MATAKRGGKAKKTAAKRGTSAKKAAPKKAAAKKTAPKKAAPKKAAPKRAAAKRAAPRRAASAAKSPGVPAGFHTITAQLSLDDAGKAIAFYEHALGAVVLDKALDTSGAKIMHAMLRVGDSMLFVNDVFPEMGGEHSRSGLWLYVPDVDASYKRAVEAGATGTQPPADMFWGDRMAHIKDPFGQTWAIATQVKVMAPEEQKAAADAFFKAMAEHGAPPAAS